MKKLNKDVRRFTQGGVTLGLGTMIVANTGSHSATILPAFSTAGRMMAPVGTAMMGAHTMRIVNKSFKTKKRRR